MFSEFTNKVKAASEKASFDFVAAHFECEKDKYSADNTGGFVNLGSAQNFLSKSEIGSRLASLDWNLADAPYREFAGTESCRQALAEYLGEMSARTIQPEHIVVGNGVISVLEALGNSILDPMDQVLVTTPIFPGLVSALTLRTRAEFIALETTAENNFQLAPTDLREKLSALANEGSLPKAVLLCSPGNPVGQVFSADEIRSFVDLAEEFDLALIVDEIYASSCFDGAQFVSALTCDSDRVFVIGGLSKDFGLAGYSTAWLHTTNPTVLPALKKQAHYFRLPAPIQRAVETFLEPQWRRPFTEKNRARLTGCYQQTCDALAEMDIPVAPAQSGLVCWLDLRPFLETADEAGQFQLYHYLLNEHRVHISPGSGFYFSQAGFYRICFSQQQETLLEGLRRIQHGLLQFQKNGSNSLTRV